MTKELKEALHKVMDACVDFKAHGVDVFFDYEPHCIGKSPFGSYSVHYYANGAWRDGVQTVINRVTDLGVDELTATLEQLKNLAVRFAFTLEVDK